ncbi:MAG: HAD-IIB family hydrolase [Terriglobia bacterium]
MIRIIYSDLDGTLLDHETYSFDQAQPALDALHHLRIPLIFVTSKTRSEVEEWRARLGNREPFIVENGGGIFVPEGYFPFSIPGGKPRPGYEVIEIGDPYESLVDALTTAAHNCHCPVRGFHEMTVNEIAAACHIPLDQAQAAKNREFDEPFEILDRGKEKHLLQAIQQLGKQWTRGGRFHHILGNNSKATAVQLLNDFYRRLDADLFTIGLGDSHNDLPLLKAVDRPILIRSAQSEEIRLKWPSLLITEKAGPEGWNDAILESLAARE